MGRAVRVHVAVCVLFLDDAVRDDVVLPRVPRLCTDDPAQPRLGARVLLLQPVLRRVWRARAHLCDGGMVSRLDADERPH